MTHSLASRENTFYLHSSNVRFASGDALPTRRAVAVHLFTRTLSSAPIENVNAHHFVAIACNFLVCFCFLSYFIVLYLF